MKIDYHPFKAALNRYLESHITPKPRPTYFNIAETYPELDNITRAFPAIQKEFDQLIAAGVSLPQYHEVDSGERAISSTTPKRWNVFVLEVLGHKVEPNRLRCPETCRAVAQVPNVVQAFFSILDPGKSVPEHEGPYLGYLRYHLGVRVPTQNPPRIVVNSQPYVWKEGEAVMFDDSWPHAVINDCDQMRAVLIVDVKRPLPLSADLANRMVLNFGRHAYGRAVARKADQFSRLQFT